MKKVLVSVLCIALLLPALAGCGWHIRLGDGEVIGPGQLYDVNDRQELDIEGVSSISMAGVSDDITILSGGDKVVAELKGQCRGTTKPVWLDARKEGGSLIIEVKYPLHINYCTTALTVTIPTAYAGDLTAGTVSGSVYADGLPFELQQVSLHSISGGIRFDAASFAALKADTVSGSIRIGGISARTTAKTISGEISLDYDTFAATDASTVSGGVTATIPGDASFKVRFGTVSGTFGSSHPALNATSAGRGFTGETAGGEETIDVSTTSGNFRIEGK
jgi:hypothetical protein